MRKLVPPALVGSLAVVLFSAVTLLAALTTPGCGPTQRPEVAPGQVSPSATQSSSNATTPTKPQQGNAALTTSASAPFTSGTPPIPMVAAARASRFVGSEACRDCHAAEFTAHRSSPHARTLGPVSGAALLALFRSQQKLVDPTRNATYSVAAVDGKPTMRVALPDGRSMALEPRYAFGSGTHGYTFLFENDEERLFMEGRISYFTRPKKWDWTPGAEPPRPGSESPLGRIFSRPTSMRCFMCHSTMVVVDDEQMYPEASIFNVGCERCHGPGGEHIRAAREGRAGAAVYGYAGANGDRMMKLCGECHRGPGVIPDAKIPTSSNTARFAGTALAASQCYRGTPGGISCMKCHDPHATSPQDLGHYERVCMGCHSKTHSESKICPVNPRSGCISCHMPSRLIDNATFHSHWIHAFRNTPSGRPNGRARAQTATTAHP